MNDKKIILRCENITKRYKNLIAIDNVSLDIFEGETLGLAGKSGCGKTTLASILLGLIQQDEGTVYFEEKDIRKFNRKQLKEFRERIQIIYQDSYAALDPRMSIYRILSEPLEIHHPELNKNQINGRIEEILKDVGLSLECLNKLPRQLSGGQRQRINIARAIVNKPKLIVCDEIVSSLDVSIQNQILNLITRLKKEYGLTCLFISHDISVLQYLSNRVITMEEGHIAKYENNIIY